MTRGKVTRLRYKDLTEDYKALIVKLYCEGVSVLRLDTEYNVNGDVTRKVLTERGIAIRGRVTGGHTEVSRILLAEQQTGRVYSEESKKKMSDSHIGKSLPEEQRKKISESLIGIKRKPEAIEKTRQAHIGTKWSPETRAKINRDKSPEHRQKLSDSLSGRPSPQKGVEWSGEKKEKVNKKREWYDKSEKKVEAERKSRESLLKLYQTEKGQILKTNKSKRMKELWSSDEFIKKQIVAHMTSPNQAEVHLLEILNFIFPGEWKFVGDGQVIINGKCPDFINVNGQKKIIELFGDYWHRDDNPKDREAVFAPFGYKTLVIWEKELKKVSKLKQKLCDFNDEPIDHRTGGG